MVGLLVLQFVVVGCANTIGEPKTPSGESGYACQIDPSNPPAPKVYQIAPVDAYKPPLRCDVSTMALAVHNLGAFRNLYGPTVQTEPPNSVIGPVIQRLNDRAKALTCAPEVPKSNCQPTLKILIFAHGGLVDHASAVKTAEALAPGMLADGYSPIFLIWNSDFATSYWDRLCCVLEGEEYDKKSGQFYFVPVRLIGDVFAGMARAFENFGQQVIRYHDSVVDTAGTEYELHPTDADNDAKDSLCSAIPGSAIPGSGMPHIGMVSKPCPTIVYPFSDADHLNAKGRQVVESTPQYYAGAPLRVATTALLTGAGTEAWDNMVRRTRLALQPPVLAIGNQSQFDLVKDQCARATETADMAGKQGDPGLSASPVARQFRPEGEGAFDIFFDRLKCEIASPRGLTTKSGQKVRVELYFFGHSMGALVGNEIIAQYPDLPWRRVVYMAAASPVRDFRLMVAPVLDCASTNGGQACDPLTPHLQQPAKDRVEMQFYNLSLHPLAESHDLEVGGVVPSGSLLEWIDEMFGGPKSVDDRMFGKWTNAEKTMPWLPPGARERMHFRVFAAQVNLRDGDAVERSVYQDECTAAPTDRPIQGGDRPRCHPIMHGEFADYSFWRDDFLCGKPCVDAP